MEWFYFISLYFIISVCCYLLEVYSFLMRDRKGMDLEVRGGGEEVRGVEEDYNQDILYKLINYISIKTILI